MMADYIRREDALFAFMPKFGKCPPPMLRRWCMGSGKTAIQFALYVAEINLKI